MSTAIAVKPSVSSKTLVEFPQIRNVFEDMEAVTRKIAQRAFNFFEDRGGWDGQDVDDWFRAETELLKPVPIELSESNDSFTIRAEVPGFDAKDLTVQAEPTSIYIHGKSEQKKEEKKGTEVKFSEVSANEVIRRIDLPSSVNPEKATARLTNGVLELVLPKTASPKAIEVKVA
jgi:HSP20 family protein